jgi:hypothetical protein
MDEGRKIFAKFLTTNSKLNLKVKKDEDLLLTQPDEKIVFRQLKQKGKQSGFDETEEISNPNETENFLSEIKSNMD